jgi:hypothetical protein
MEEQKFYRVSIFNLVADIFKKHNVRILLVGGDALNAYKI